MKTIWAFIFLLQILPRGGFAQNELGGVAGNTVVRKNDNQVVLVSGLKDGDVVMGLKGLSRTVSECNVVSTIEQGTTELAGNFSFSHWLYDNGKMSTHEQLQPSIYGLADAHSYEVLTDCELVKAETPNGVSYFSPLSSAFCGTPSMSWYDYHVLFGTLAEIMTKSGAFWADIRNYKDCEAGPTCTVPSWRVALPPICTTMMQCVKKKAQATCDTLNTLSNAFVKEHLPAELQSKFTSAFPTLGNAVMARKIPPEIPPEGTKKWWQYLMFWRWGVWRCEWLNFDINWRSPWVIAATVVIGVFILAATAVCCSLLIEHKEGDYSYESFGSGEYNEHDYESHHTHSATHTATVTKDGVHD